VFDLDGTLSDPFDGIWRSVNHALSVLGMGSIPQSDFGAWIGPPIDQTFRELAPDTDAAGVTRLVAAFRERYGETGYAENKLYPGVPAMLETLKEAGYHCGVCTAKRADFASRILDLFEIDHRFTFVCGGDVGITKAMQLSGLLEQGTIDRDAIMIGDRASDLSAARANALCGIGVGWGYGSTEELQAERPLAVARSPAQLTTLLLDMTEDG
jgi:phosphoglycolate phosphatase